MAEARGVSLAHIHVHCLMTCEIRRRYDAAEECAQSALSLDPRFAKARYRRGLARKGNLQLAAAVFGALTRATPSYFDAEQSH